MNLAEVADELYALPLGDFIAARTERAKQARADGDKDLAAQIRKLTKPSTSAWAVNTLGRRAPAELDRVLDLGAALRAAQETLDGAELRELTRQRQALIAELVRRTRAEAGDAGHPISEAVAAEVEQTLRAAMADEQAAAVVRSHQLTTAMTASGAGQLQSASPPARAASPSTSARAAKAVQADPDEARRQVEEALAGAAEAGRLVNAAEKELQSQQERVDAAADHQADLRAAIRELEETLRERTSELTSITEELDAEREALSAAERSAAAARKAADEADERLAALQHST